MTALILKQAVGDWKTNVYIKPLFYSSSSSHSYNKCRKNIRLGSFSSPNKHTVCLCHMLSLHCPVLFEEPRNQGKLSSALTPSVCQEACGLHTSSGLTFLLKSLSSSLKQQNLLLAPGLSLQPTLAVRELASATGQRSQAGNASVLPWPSSSHPVIPVALFSAFSVCWSPRPGASLQRMTSFPAPSSFSQAPWQLNYKPVLLEWQLLAIFFAKCVIGFSGTLENQP